MYLAVFDSCHSPPALYFSFLIAIFLLPFLFPVVYMEMKRRLGGG
jgi:hypothetical protein